MKFQHIFWDNDGVLVNTERYYFQASREALLKEGIVLSERQFISISLTEGRSIFELAMAQGLPLKTIDNLRRWRNSRYAELIAEEDLVIDGVREVLAALHGRISMSIVTGSQKKHFEIIHKNTKLLHFFDFILTREDYTSSKPSADPYLLALQQSMQEAENVLVIEDSPRGLKAAKAAGLTCWVILGEHSEKSAFPHADRILSRIEEIPALIQ